MIGTLAGRRKRKVRVSFAVEVGLVTAMPAQYPPCHDDSTTTEATSPWVCAGVGEGDAVAVGFGVGEGFGVGVGDGLGEAVGFGEAVGEGFGVSVGDGLGDGVGEGFGERLGDGFGVARSRSLPGFLEGHGVGAGRILLTPVGAQATGGHAYVGGIQVPVHVEIGNVPVLALAHVVGERAELTK